MSPWMWYWKEPEDDAWGDECATREEAIASAERELPPGAAFEVQEARMSEAKEHEGSDFIPFLRTRNRESLIAALSTANTQGGAS